MKPAARLFAALLLACLALNLAGCLPIGFRASTQMIGAPLLGAR